MVIKALEGLKDDNIFYVICGKGKLNERYKQFAEKLGVAEKVILAGYRDDISDIYKAADLFVFPSVREGLPVALMEAMASGIPVICSRIRGNTDLVEDDALFDPKQPEQIVTKIQKYRSNDVSGEIERNYRKLDEFSSDKVMSIMLSLYLD